MSLPCSPRQGLSIHVCPRWIARGRPSAYASTTCFTRFSCYKRSHSSPEWCAIVGIKLFLTISLVFNHRGIPVTDRRSFPFSFQFFINTQLLLPLLVAPCSTRQPSCSPWSIRSGYLFSGSQLLRQARKSIRFAGQTDFWPSRCAANSA